MRIMTSIAGRFSELAESLDARHVRHAKIDDGDIHRLVGGDFDGLSALSARRME